MEGRCVHRDVIVHASSFMSVPARENRYIAVHRFATVIVTPDITRLAVGQQSVDSVLVFAHGQYDRSSFVWAKSLDRMLSHRRKKVFNDLPAVLDHPFPPLPPSTRDAVSGRLQQSISLRQSFHNAVPPFVELFVSMGESLRPARIKSESIYRLLLDSFSH